VDKQTLLREADFLVLLLPYSAESHHIIGAAELAQMKPTAHLINVARGGIVDDAALISALRQRRLSGAALDVFEGEPKLNPGFPRTRQCHFDATHRVGFARDAHGHGDDCGEQPDCCAFRPASAQPAESRRLEMNPKAGRNHRDTEAQRRTEDFLSQISVSLCLCGEVLV
jgi:hypothetical protein